MSIYSLAAVFSGILIKPLEFKAEDLIVGTKLVELLAFMIENQEVLF